MGNVFGGGSKPKAPAPISPVPTPVDLSADIKQREQDRRRQRIVASGRQGTILTQGQSLSAGGASILGRST